MINLESIFVLVRGGSGDVFIGLIGGLLVIILIKILLFEVVKIVVWWYV